MADIADHWCGMFTIGGQIVSKILGSRMDFCEGDGNLRVSVCFLGVKLCEGIKVYKRQLLFGCVALYADLHGSRLLSLQKK